ncbi:hypothetical protein FisN_9Hh397 [Fistulifera solaris]|uniref:Uncharacterized protein n=1 Tax=Fistulifera solaris TaxID=1519565 RepID=A0A1Z5KCX5_FISSO|nr:hypothetical protein FisN_9Hh397 [Fistulifera solaris]|eukprot:GAX24144.1 hypothetical protein FisN_9Hh397 [Fistulifera solaris]
MNEDLQQKNRRSDDIRTDDSSLSSSFSLASKYSQRTGYLQTLSLVLNAALMLYAHLGVSGVIYSNQPRVDINTNTTNNATGTCTLKDTEIWNALGGAANRSITNSFCSQQTGCLVDVQCNTECFVENFGYSTACAECFAVLPQCGLQNGCAFACAQDSQSDQCQTCNLPCQQVFYNCTGFFSSARYVYRHRRREQEEQSDTCIIIDPKEQEGTPIEYYPVYEIKFLNALQDAWNGDAKLLAFLVVIFSGLWPYLKNVLLMFAWMTHSIDTRSRLLKWLKRLGKYTLVDVYVVLILLVGVWLQALIGETTIKIRGEARPAIIAFLVATFWEFWHIEWMAALHQESLKEHNKEADHETQETADVERPLLAALQFQNAYNSSNPGHSCRSVTFALYFVGLSWATSMALYVVGSISEILRFQTTEGEQRDVVCERSYNVFTLGTELLSDEAMRDSSAEPAMWTLCMAYLLLVVVSPLVVHLIQMLALLGAVSNSMILRLGDSIWTFASVDVLLMGVYIVQYKFDALINRLAGDAGSDILGVNGEMGPGFFLLLAYSISSGFVQYFVNSAAATRYNHDPYYQIDYLWTKVLGGLVLDVDRSSD